MVVYNQEIAKTEDMAPSDVLGKLEKNIYDYPEYNFPDIIKEKVIKKGESIIEQRYFYYFPNGEKHHIVFPLIPISTKIKSKEL